MMPQSIRCVAHAIGAAIVAAPDFAAATTMASALSTDSRKPSPNAIFVALVGPNFDGHDHVEAAFAAGAIAAVVAARHAASHTPPPGRCLLVVADTQRALEDLGRAIRNRHAGRFVAITGSVGKTTIKNMVAAALTTFGPTAATPGNLNNHIGLPLTLGLTTGAETHVVLELGMSAAGEIAHLAGIARPDVTIVCAAAAAHLAAFDSVDGIADAKCELFEHQPYGAIAIANADDPRILPRARALIGDGLLTWGRHPDATVRVISAEHMVSASGVALAVTLTCDNETLQFQLATIGAHNALNAAAAIAACKALGLPLGPAAASLGAHFRTAPHRLEPVSIAPGLTVIDDAYNANPASMVAALDTLDTLASAAPTRPAIALVLGTMHELGPESPALHVDIGRRAAALRPDLVIATGPEAPFILAGLGSAARRSIATPDVAAAIDDLVAFGTASTPALILLKGSRAERLERVIEPLRTRAAHLEGGV